jgi:hypothetical protein
MTQSPATMPVAKKKRSRAGELIGVVVVIGLVVLAAFYQETISSFFRLKMWDKAAPARAAEQFLIAGKKGDKNAANALLGITNFQDLIIDGKWRGYYFVSMPGRMDYDFQHLAPQGEPKATDVEYFTLESGWVELKIPDSTGKPVKYRMEIKDGSWKVMDISGGKLPAAAPAPPSGGKPTAAPGSKPAGSVPGGKK